MYWVMLVFIIILELAVTYLHQRYIFFSCKSSYLQNSTGDKKVLLFWRSTAAGQDVTNSNLRYLMDDENIKFNELHWTKILTLPYILTHFSVISFHGHLFSLICCDTWWVASFSRRWIRRGTRVGSEKMSWQGWLPCWAADLWLSWASWVARVSKDLKLIPLLRCCIDSIWIALSWYWLQISDIDSGERQWLQTCRKSRVCKRDLRQQRDA